MNAEENYYNELLTIFGQITTATMFIPVAVVLVKYRQFNRAVWAFWWFALAILCCSLLEVVFIWSVNAYIDFWLPYLKYWEIGNTHFLQIVSYLNSFALFGWCYSLLFGGRVRQYLQWSSLILSGMALIDYLWITGYKNPSVISPIVAGLYGTFLPMLYLWFLSRSDQRVSFFQVPYVWFSYSFVLLNLTTLLFYFVSAKLYQTDFSLFVKASLGRNVLIISQSFLYAYGFWLTFYVKYVKPVTAN